MLVQNKILKIILGTAQLGLNYGPNKDAYVVSSERSNEILNHAYDLGIRYLDTATGYGESHKHVGNFHHEHSQKIFKIFTKITMEEFQKNSNIIDEIIEDLGINHIEGILLHRQEDAMNEAFRSYLFQKKAEGKINNVGLSLYYGSDFLKVVSFFKPDFVQLPFNVLNNTSLHSEEFEYLKNHNIKIHGRSCFLRGALVEQGRTNAPAEVIPWLDKISSLSESAKITQEDLCINYATQSEEVEKIAIGIDNIDQLTNNLASLSINIPNELMAEIEKIKIPNPDILDLRKW
jgi:aryl-alcohol dehydrogenase-like predicted oxidoreductase